MKKTLIILIILAVISLAGVLLIKEENPLGMVGDNWIQDSIVCEEVSVGTTNTLVVANDVGREYLSVCNTVATEAAVQTIYLTIASSTEVAVAKDKQGIRLGFNDCFELGRDYLMFPNAIYGIATTSAVSVGVCRR